MNTEQFDQLVNTVHAKCKDVLAKKGVDYTPDKDNRLSQFEEIAKEVGITPRQVIGVFLLKHSESIHKVIRGEKLYGEQLEQKVVDEINYLCLLLAQVSGEGDMTTDRPQQFKVEDVLDGDDIITRQNATS